MKKLLLVLLSFSLFLTFSCAHKKEKTSVNLTGIELPSAPKAVGNYQTYSISKKWVYINQIALVNGKIVTPGKIGQEVSMDQAKEATYRSTLNVLAVLKEATGGDLSKVKKCVQISGHFNTGPNFTEHALVLNEASNLLVQVFGEAGKHTRGAFGAASLPLNSPVEIQAIFELW